VTGTPASWGPRGEIAYASRQGLWLVSSDGANPRLVARPDTAANIFSFRAPDILPDGNHALVTLVGRGGGVGASRIGVVSLRDGSVSELDLRGVKPMYAGNGKVVFSRDGVLYAVPFSPRKRAVTGPPVVLLDEVRQTVNSGSTSAAVSRSGVLAYQAGSGAEGGLRQLYVVDREGRERLLPAGQRQFADVRVSPDGRRVVLTIGAAPQAGLWIYEMSAGTLTRLTPDGARIRGVWTRDGSRVVYPDRTDADSIRVMSRVWDLSAPPVDLAPSATHGDLWEVSLGPVRGYAALRQGSGGTANILIAPSDSLAAARPFVANPATELAPSVSPNGRVLAYTSNESGRTQVYVTPLPGPGPRVPVSVDGGQEPVWSADGSMLYYRGPSRLMTATITERPALAVTARDSLFEDDYSRDAAHTQYDVFPGGQEFLMTRGADRFAPTYVVMNWPQMSRIRGARGGG